MSQQDWHEALIRRIGPFEDEKVLIYVSDPEYTGTLFSDKKDEGKHIFVHIICLTTRRLVMAFRREGLDPIGPTVWCYYPLSSLLKVTETGYGTISFYFQGDESVTISPKSGIGDPEREKAQSAQSILLKELVRLIFDRK